MSIFEKKYSNTMNKIISTMLLELMFLTLFFQTVLETIVDTK
jgi:hypothetical protein